MTFVLARAAAIFVTTHLAFVALAITLFASG
jgi:hypothetical protein